MLKIQSTFSGLMVARERGAHKVCNDNRVVFTATRRERTFMEHKIPQRRIKWTAPSRLFFKKNHKTAAQKTEPVPIMKVVRGFTFVPKALLDTAKAPASTNSTGGASSWKNSKVSKNANVNASRK